MAILKSTMITGIEVDYWKWRIINTAMNIDNRRKWTVLTRNQQQWQEMSGDDKKETVMAGNELWQHKKNGDDRKWTAMTGNERRWREMNGDDRKWKMMTENELWWMKMNGDDRKWMAMTGNKKRRQEINGKNSKLMVII